MPFTRLFRGWPRLAATLAFTALAALPGAAAAQTPPAATAVAFSPRFDRDVTLLVGTNAGEIWSLRVCNC